MSQYNTGTIAITNGSAAVVGTGTLWNTEATAGDWLMVLGDGLVYEILSITDDTNLTLTNTFQGSTAATATYVITRDFTPNYGFALMGRADQETAAIYTRAITSIDSALTSYTVGASALEAQHWANNAEDVLVQEGDLVDDYSSLHWSIKASYWATTTGALVESLDYSAKEFAIGVFVPTGSAKQWASEVEDTIVASGLYSALHYSAKSAISAAAALVSEGLADADASATAADVITTNADAATTTQDAIDTAADVVLTNADVVVTTQDAIDTAADVVLTNADVVTTNADAATTTQDAIDTAADAAQVALDLIDTNQDTIDTAADLVATNQDTIDTAADLVLTNADVVSTAADVVSAEAAWDSFDDRYLGSKATDPTLDNDSNALAEGAMYWNSTNKVLRIYDGAAWQDTGSATANITEWTATAGQTTFTGTDDNALALAYTAGYLMVFRNGTLLDPDDYTATTGSSVVLDTGADLNDTLNFIGFGTFDVANTYTKTEADATFAPIARSADNLVINGGFNIAQRGTTFTAPASADYTLDRWVYVAAGAGVVEVTQYSGLSSSHPHHYDMRIETTTADTSLAVTDLYSIRTPIEGNMIADSGWGSAVAKSVTLSFFSNHQKTGTYCIALRNGSSNRSYIAEYTQAVAGTWEEQIITIPGDTTGTWGKSNDIGIEITFCIAAPATSNWVGTADTWTATNDLHTANQVNGMDNTANVFRLSDVKLEYGTVATDYVLRPFGEELALCQRYFEMSYPQGTAPGTPWGNGTFFVYLTGLPSSARDTGSSLNFAVAKLDVPTVTLYSNGTGNSGKVRNNITSADITATVFNPNENGFRWSATLASATGVNITGQWSAEAEL